MMKWNYKAKNGQHLLCDHWYIGQTPPLLQYSRKRVTRCVLRVVWNFLLFFYVGVVGDEGEDD